MTQYTKDGISKRAEDVIRPLPDLHQQPQPWNIEKPGRHCLSVPYRSAGLFLSGVMLAGLGVSILLAIIFRFKETTYTHCRVANYCPSTSAAIATTPSAYIWRLVICLCSLPRLLFVIFRYNFYINITGESSACYKAVCHLCFIAEILENLSLIGLSCISSDDNYDIHEVLFISFQVTAMVHMLLMCLVFKMATTYSGDHVIPDEIQLGIVKRNNALQRKILFCVLNFLVFFVSIYFFFRHQSRCEPGVYSLFAIFEYLVVVTNIMFHKEAWMDFSNRSIVYGGQLEHNKGV